VQAQRKLLAQHSLKEIIEPPATKAEGSPQPQESPPTKESPA